MNLAVALFSVAVWSVPVSQVQQVPRPEPDQHLSYWMNTSRTHPHTLIRKNAVHVLGQLKRPEAVPIIIEALHDESYQVRLEAAQALGHQGDERAFTALREVIERDPDRSVRRAAERSIELINAYLEYQKQNEDPKPSS